MGIHHTSGGFFDPAPLRFYSKYSLLLIRRRVLIIGNYRAIIRHASRQVTIQLKDTHKIGAKVVCIKKVPL